MTASEDLEQVKVNALAPKKVTEAADSTTVEQHDPDKQLAVVKAVAADQAMTQSPTRGIRLFRWAPPSALG